MQKNGTRPGAVEGERSSIDTATGRNTTRWSANRKKEAVLRLMRGEPVDALSRELGVEIYRLEEWRDKALQGIDTALKARENDPLTAELDAAKRRIGEISMENELLREKIKKQFPLARGRSKR
jgi:transposase